MKTICEFLGEVVERKWIWLFLLTFQIYGFRRSREVFVDEIELSTTRISQNALLDQWLWHAIAICRTARVDGSLEDAKVCCQHVMNRCQ